MNANELCQITTLLNKSFLLFKESVLLNWKNIPALQKVL